MKKVIKSGVLHSEVPMVLRLLLIILWARFPIWQYSFGFFNMVPSFKGKGESGLATLIVLLLVLSIKYVYKKIRVVDYFLYFLIIFVYFVQYMLFPENIKLLEEYQTVFLFCTVPYFFFGLTLDIKKMLNDFRIVSIASILVMFYTYIFTGGLAVLFETEALREYMSGAYYVFPHLMLLTWLSVKNKNLIDIVFSAMGFATMIAMGIRGSVVLYVLFLVICFYLKWGYHKKKRLRLFLFAIIALLILPELMSILRDYLSIRLPSLRVFELLESNRLFSSAGRDDIRSNIIDQLLVSPFLGYGITGDQVTVGAYAHNIELELMMHFGIIIGLLLIGLIFYLLIRTLYYSRNTMERWFLVLIAMAGFVKLHISNTYLDEPYLFLMIGYCINLIRNRMKLTPEHA